MNRIRIVVYFGLFIWFSPLWGKVGLPEEKRLQRDATFFEAIKFFQLGQTQEAFVSFEKCITIDPAFSEGYYYLGLLHEKKGNRPLSLSLFEKAHFLRPGQYYIHEALAQSYVKSGQYVKAAETFEKIAQKHSQKGIHLKDAGFYYRLANKNNKALKVYQILEKKQGVQEEFSLAKKHIYLTLNKSSKALSELKKLSESYPKELKYMGMLADFYMDIGRKKEGLEIYYNILKINENNGIAHFSLADYYAENGVIRDSFEFHIWWAFSDPNLPAVNKLPALLESKRNPSWQIPPALKSKLYHQLTVVHSGEPMVWEAIGDYQVAEQSVNEGLMSYERAIQLSSNPHPALFEKTLKNASILPPQKSLNLARNAVSAHPAQPAFHEYLLNELSRNSMWEELVQKAISATELFPNEPELMASFLERGGQAAHQIGNTSMFDSLYQSALDLSPGAHAIRNNFAWYLALQNRRLDAALMHINKVLLSQPNDPNVLDTRGFVYEKQGSFSEAILDYERALEYKFAEGTTARLADLYIKTGSKEKLKALQQKRKDLGFLKE